MTSYEDMREFLAQHPVRIPNTFPEPQPGQVWRATWDDVVLNIYLTEVADGTLRALPITAHTEAVNNPLAHVDAGESPLGYTSAVWRGPETDLPLFVLDGCYGSIHDLTQEPPATGRTPLSEPAREADPGWQMAESINRQLAELTCARWIPEVRPVGPVRDLIRQANLTVRAASEQVPVSSNLFRYILSASWWLPESAEAALAEALGVEVPELPRTDAFANCPDLPAEIDTVVRKRAFRLKSSHSGVTEGEARFTAAEHVLLAAARTADRNADARSRWSQLLDDYLTDA